MKPGRPVIESVSMRRAMRSKEDQERMIREGYEIDDEFLGNGVSKKVKSVSKARSQSAVSDFSLPDAPLFELPESTALQTKSNQLLTKEREMQMKLLAQAPMFGGVEKMSAMLANIDDKKLSAMLKNMGYEEIEPLAVRNAVQSLVQIKEEGKIETVTQGSAIPKTSLDTDGFYDYIRRCMKSDEAGARAEAPKIIDTANLLSLSAGSSGLSPRALKVMKGVHTAYGERKCANCVAFNQSAKLCGKLSIAVEVADVCDGWERGSYY
ncbi:MAG: hypothetical protein SFU91_07925 [Chloroherpetonaceae bacterium]|nr:hypothetical protein [Chloroherpetonaceae bacterium]